MCVMATAGIIGGTGYTGVELIRLLVEHPRIELTQITSRQNAGQSVASMFPHLAGRTDLVFSETLGALDSLDLVFVAAPSGVAMNAAQELIEKGIKVIDLSADFRIKDASLWERWYGETHASPALLSDAVYGLPELYRAAIADAQLVANPGCYPTSVILGYAPLLRAKVIDAEFLVADSKSGVSGAGRQAHTHLLSAEVEGNMAAYGASKHRHFPEIACQLREIAGISPNFSFTPHLAPMTRGIFSTLYFKTDETQDALHDVLRDAWKAEPFVSVLDAGAHPQTRTVRGTNQCHMAVHKPEDSDIGKLLVVIDNLIKGAAGQAVQNMNLMFAWDEVAGLEATALMP